VIPLLVVVGAMLGAPCRYLVDRYVQSRHDSVFPWGTLSVNVGGSFVLGFVVTATAPAAVVALVGSGFCGALTTYSTFSYETVRLAEDGARFYALANVAATLVAGLGAALCGAALASSV